MELVKGVHYIDMYAGTAVIAGDRLILIDTGASEDGASILNYLRKMRWKPTDIAHIVMTHTHPDHVAGLAAMREATGAKVAAHEAEADYIARTKDYPGPPGKQRHRPVPVDVRLTDGQRYEGLLVVHTPGHTPGSIALLSDEHDLCIAGDAFRNEGGIGPMSDEYNIDPAAHRESMRKLAAHDFEAMICGHGPPLAKGAGAQLQAAVAKL